MAQKSKSSKAKTRKTKAKKAPVKKAPAKKAPGKKAPAKKAPARRKAAASSRKDASSVPKELQLRLMSLAQQMDKSLDALMLQALCEFADAWEDHYRTINAMVEEDDRIQLVVKPE